MAATPLHLVFARCNFWQLLQPRNLRRGWITPAYPSIVGSVAPPKTVVKAIRAAWCKTHVVMLPWKVIRLFKRKRAGFSRASHFPLKQLIVEVFELLGSVTKCHGQSTLTWVVPFTSHFCLQVDQSLASNLRTNARQRFRWVGWGWV